MPTFKEVAKLIDEESRFDPWARVRHKYLNEFKTLTGRNVIVYYSGWLQKPSAHPSTYSVTDLDVQGFMGACSGLETELGLDLFLHTPGGQLSATQAIVNYLHQKFDDIRVVVPQIAMSAGTMIACASNRIAMGKQSSLGPIDPQLGGLPAHGLIAEFERAYKEISEDATSNQSKRHLWQPIIAKYSPTLIGECQNAIDLAEKMVQEWLINYMFKDDPSAEDKARNVVSSIGNHSETKQHDRHLAYEECRNFGLVIEKIEEDQDFQNAVLSVHHACMHTLGSTNTMKIIENHNRETFNIEVA